MTTTEIHMSKRAHPITDPKDIITMATDGPDLPSAHAEVRAAYERYEEARAATRGHGASSPQTANLLLAGHSLAVAVERELAEGPRDRDGGGFAPRGAAERGYGGRPPRGGLPPVRDPGPSIGAPAGVEVPSGDLVERLEAVARSIQAPMFDRFGAALVLGEAAGQLSAGRPPTAGEVLAHLEAGGQVEMWEVIDWDEWEDQPEASQRWVRIHPDFAGPLMSVLRAADPATPQPGTRLVAA